VTRRRAIVVLLVAATTLIVVELALGAMDHGRVTLSSPCSATVTLPGDNLDARVQRLILRALDNAACALGTSREELVLSFSPQGAKRFGLRSNKDVEQVLRRALVQAIDQAEAEGDLGSVAASVLRELAKRAPLDLVLEAARHAGTIAALANLLP
jgi:hypothetical protein